MTLNGLLTSLGQIAIHDMLVNWAGAGTSIYQVNDLTQRDYPCFFASPTGTHRVENAYTTHQLSLFYFDRLLEDSSNDIDIQSTAIEVLKNIIKKAAFVDGIVAVDDEYTITLFVETERFKDRCSGAYATVEITIVNDSECVIYSNDEPEPSPTGATDEYLTFEILSAGTLTWKTWESDVDREIFISRDSGQTWESVTSSAAGTDIPAAAGDTILLKGYNYSYRGVAFSGSTADFNAYGNIMSLIYGDDFQDKTAFPSGTEYNFFRLFFGVQVHDASNLILPATRLARYCYRHMFEGCSSLTEAPSLPATTLAYGCYDKMFYDCTALTEAPALPATALEEFCYLEMFHGCSSLTSAPALPATTLTQSCYYGMFSACSSLTAAPALPATRLAPYCYQYMFSGCLSLSEVTCLATSLGTDSTADWLEGVAANGTFTKAASMEDWITGISGIPEGWTVIDAEE